MPTTSNSGTRHCGTSTCQMAQTHSECFTRATDTAKPGSGTRKARFECAFTSDHHLTTEFLYFLVGSDLSRIHLPHSWIRDRFCSWFLFGTHFGLGLRRARTLCDAASWQLQTQTHTICAGARGASSPQSRQTNAFTSRQDRMDSMGICKE